MDAHGCIFSSVYTKRKRQLHPYYEKAGLTVMFRCLCDEGTFTVIFSELEELYSLFCTCFVFHTFLLPVPQHAIQFIHKGSKSLQHTWLVFSHLSRWTLLSIAFKKMLKWCTIINCTPMPVNKLQTHTHTHTACAFPSVYWLWMWYNSITVRRYRAVLLDHSRSLF